MNTPTFLRQYATLAGLIILLIVAFLLKNTDTTTLMGLGSDPLHELNTPTSPVDSTDQVDSHSKAKNRAVSSANMAASISQAIESRFRSQIEPMPDFAAFTEVSTKKLNFFNYLKKLSKTANNKIVQLRSELKKINPQQLTQKQGQLLKRLSKSYKVQSLVAAEQIDLLLYKIGIIPSALVLAQAANESAWGTSRFATQGNNLFGQWCFSSGCGLVPSGRPDGANYEVRKFKDPQASVDAYMRNLNSHGSYAGLRRIRTCLTAKGEAVTARALSAGLMSYSSRGVDYIDDIRSMIRVNKLEPWQKSWWGNSGQHPCSELVQLVRPKVATEDPIHGITDPEAQ